jgi:hypothetical protein
MLLKCSKINDPDGSYFIKASCGNYLSYVADCNNAATVDLWYQPTYNQNFKFIAANSAQDQLYIEAVGRASVIVIKLFSSSLKEGQNKLGHFGHMFFGSFGKPYMWFSKNLENPYIFKL